ncbi:MAG: nitroreductase family protein, partial [Planctomycetota bacterium]
RSFTACDISRDELLKIIDAGRRAPSGNNRQPWEFILIEEASTLEKLGTVQNCIAEASAAIAVVVDENATDYWKEDASAAIENMLLAVVGLGYASLWVEGYVLRHENMAKSVLEVPGDQRLLAILPIGEPAGEPHQAEKKTMDEVLHVNRYGRRDG